MSEEEFIQLKCELEEHAANCTGWISPEFESFIDRLLNELGFSQEMLEVLKLIEDPKYSSAKRAIHAALKELLQDPASTAERRSLVLVAGEPGWSEFSEKLCWHVGEVCSQEEYDKLVRLSSAPSVIADLELGSNLSLVGSDPVAAVASTLAYYRERKSGALTILDQLFQRLPPETDFAAVDALLPPSQREKDTPHWQHASLISAWGRADPSAAANYIVDNSDQFPPEMMVYVVAPYARDHTKNAIIWVQEFPPGPYFDAAVSAVVDQIGDTRFDKARELAARIGDPEIRNNSLRMIDTYESGKR
ncbi:MAG: hypothetical protein ACSHX9_12295 [Luteolibacter sp.]